MKGPAVGQVVLTWHGNGSGNGNGNGKWQMARAVGQMSGASPLLLLSWVIAPATKWVHPCVRVQTCTCTSTCMTVLPSYSMDVPSYK